MKSKIYLCIVIFVMFNSVLYALDNVHPHRILMALEIQEQLDVYKDKSERLEDRLLDAYNDLSQSESDKMQMGKDIQGLLNELDIVTQKFDVAVDIIQDYEIRVQEQKKSLDAREDIFFVLCVVVGVRMILVIVGWILAGLKIKVPLWLDILL